MADKRMNDFAIRSFLSYIYGESADGSQGKISMEDIFSNQFIFRGKNIGIHADNLSFGFYSMYEQDPSSYGYPFANGFIFSFNFGNTGICVQIAINPLNFVYIRSRWSSWTEWKKLH